MANIRRLQDIQINDIDLIETYKDTFDESIETAQNLINTDILKSYVLQAEWMNDTKEKIEELEEHKNTNFDDDFVSETEEFQFNIDEFIYINEYDNYTQYYKNNFVLYNDEIYFCIKNSLNNLPTNTTYWLKIGLKGEEGQYSLGVVYRGIWNNYTIYYKYDLISYDDNLYVATQDNIHSQPVSNNNSNNDDNVNDENNNDNPNQQIEGMRFLNDSLFLDDELYLKGTNDVWFLLADTDELSRIYDSPEDYTLLPVNSIFFQKL